MRDVIALIGMLSTGCTSRADHNDIPFLPPQPPLPPTTRNHPVLTPQAYALLSSPQSTPTIPLPSLPLPLSALLSLRLPIPYLPPGASALARGASAAGILKGLLSQNANINTGGRVPLISINPAGPLGYAWAIADAAVLEEERGRVERGVMGEPVGAGVRFSIWQWWCGGFTWVCMLCGKQCARHWHAMIARMGN